MMSMTLGNRLRRMREARRFTLAQLATRAKISKSLLINLEHDRANPTLSTLERIAKALGVRFFAAFLVTVEKEPQGRRARR